MVQTTGASPTLIQAPAGAAESVPQRFRRPCRGSSNFLSVTGGLHHRLISNVPSGQLAVFPILTRDEMRSRRFEVEDFAKQILRNAGTTSLCYCSADFVEQPGPGVGPVILCRARRNAERLRRFIMR